MCEATSSLWPRRNHGPDRLGKPVPARVRVPPAGAPAGLARPASTAPPSAWPARPSSSASPARWSSSCRRSCWRAGWAASSSASMSMPGPGCRWSATSSISACRSPRSAPFPEYTQRNDLDGLRGFLIGSRWIVFATATTVAVAGALAVHALEPSLDRGTVMPLYLACVALPLYPVSNMLDGLARPYNAVNIALLPPFVLRPLMLIAAMAAAHRVRHRRRRDDRDGRVRLRHLDDDARSARPVQPLPRPAECRPDRGATMSAPGSRRRARSSRSGPSTCC